ncbi:MAG: hypothetical protein AAF497_27580, partial [Planctomycetota bacterium]
PDDVTVFYLFNPFFGPVLEDVITNIADSCERCPRKIYLIACNNVDRLASAFVDIEWIKLVQRRHYYPYDCAIFAGEKSGD